MGSELKLIRFIGITEYKSRHPTQWAQNVDDWLHLLIDELSPSHPVGSEHTDIRAETTQWKKSPSHPVGSEQQNQQETQGGEASRHPTQWAQNSHEWIWNLITGEVIFVAIPPSGLRTKYSQDTGKFYYVSLSHPVGSEPFRLLVG